MRPEDIAAECAKHFAALKEAVDTGKVTWNHDEEHDAYMGTCPGYAVVVTRNDGVLTSTENFLIIHMTREMAAFCYAAAAKH